MKKNATGYILKLTLTLFIITAVVAVMLGAVYAITKEHIAAHTAQKTAEAIREVLPSDAEPEELSDYTDESGAVTHFYKVGEDGYAVELVVGGSQGDIDMMVGVAADGTVSGVSFISMAETAGLGAVAAQNGAKGEAFRSQFIGMSGEVLVTKDGGSVDSISGATVTSRAVALGVTDALACVAANS